MNLEKKNLAGLEPVSYEHPFDKAALKALKAIPAFDKVTNFVLNWAYIKWHLIELQGSNFRVTRDSCPDLYKLAKEVGRRLDIRDFPKIYTQWGYFINAYTAGYDDNVLLVIYSGAVDLLEDEELKFVVGHEMGHIKSGHNLYHYMASIIGGISAFIPGGQAAIAPIYATLKYWDRMSEFTADRAGLLACQDIDVAVNAILKMSGLPMKYFDKMNREAFLEQAKEFEEEFGGVTDKAIKAISILDESHPWTVMRAAELIKWEASHEYQNILDSVKKHSCNNWIPIDSKVCPFCGTTCDD